MLRPRLGQTTEVHANIQIFIDIITLDKMVLDADSQTGAVDACEVSIKVTIESRDVAQI